MTATLTRLLCIGLVAALSVAGAGCSHDSGEAESAGTTAAVSGPTEPAESTEPVETDVLATEVVSTDVQTTDAAAGPTAFDLTSLPALISSAEAATSDPTITPLGIAQGAIGFPYEIPVLDGSTLSGFSGRLAAHDADGDRYSFSYSAIAPDGTVADVDVNLADNGPGSAQIVDTWDPIMQALGFERTNSIASDPGDPGPNSVNHVCVASSPARSFDGIDGEVSPVFVWSDEDILGATYGGGRALGRYRVDLDVTTTAGTGIPFPLVNAVLNVLPIPDGATVSGISVDMKTREGSSFDAAKGLTYISVHLDWEAPADMPDQIVDFYADPQAVFTDGSTLIAGEADFFDEGSVVASELSDYDVVDKRLSLILIRRYGVILGIEARDDGTQPATISFDLDIDSIAPQLALPVG